MFLNAEYRRGAENAEFTFPSSAPLRSLRFKEGTCLVVRLPTTIPAVLDVFETQSIGEEQSTQSLRFRLSAPLRSLRFRKGTCLVVRRRQLSLQF